MAWEWFSSRCFCPKNYIFTKTFLPFVLSHHIMCNGGKIDQVQVLVSAHFLRHSAFVVLFCYRSIMKLQWTFCLQSPILKGVRNTLLCSFSSPKHCSITILLVTFLSSWWQRHSIWLLDRRCRWSELVIIEWVGVFWVWSQNQPDFRGAIWCCKLPQKVTSCTQTAFMYYLGACDFNGNYTGTRYVLNEDWKKCWDYRWFQDGSDLLFLTRKWIRVFLFIALKTDLLLAISLIATGPSCLQRLIDSKGAIFKAW